MGLLSAPSIPLPGVSPKSRSFECCNTRFELQARGWHSGPALDRAERTARDLEAQLNAFDADSAVAELNRDGEVSNRHVATLVERGLAYRERTDGAFDVRLGRVERRIKDYLRGASDREPQPFEPVDGRCEPPEIRVSGDHVEADRPVDLNGLAKGYVVDRVQELLSGPGRTGFVNGGGDIAGSAGPVGIESPYGDDAPLLVVETAWNVATSAGYRQRRRGLDHVYDPRTGRIGSRHDLVTVVAERDCTAADALATTLAALPVDAALGLTNDWPGLEALVVHAGVFHRTEGFEDHVRAR